MTEGLIYTQHTDRGEEVERERERREERRGEAKREEGWKIGKRGRGRKK